MLNHLEIKCKTCNGIGQNLDYNSAVMYTSKECSDCKGTGMLLTKKGKELIEFLNRHNPLSKQQILNALE